MLMPTMRTNVFDDLFNNPFFTKSESSMMKTDIKEHDNCYDLMIDLPGVKKEDIKVETDDNELTVTAVRNARVVEEEEEKKEEAPKPVMEYKKKYILPESADMSSVMAKYEDGILILYIEKKGEFVKEKKNIVIE